MKNSFFKNNDWEGDWENYYWDLFKAYFLVHYTSLEGGIAKLTKLKQAIKDPLLNMLSFSSYVIGGFNNTSAETLEKEFK